MTNCMSLSRTSLSTSFTSCRGRRDDDHMKQTPRGHEALCVHKRQYLPEPDDLFAVPGVVTVHRVPLPVLKVDLLHAAQHHLHQPNIRHSSCSAGTNTNTSTAHLQLFFIKVLEPLKRNDLIEPIQERFGLTFDPTREPPLCHQTAGHATNHNSPSKKL